MALVTISDPSRETYRQFTFFQNDCQYLRCLSNAIGKNL